jgi:hypothetical protein
MRQTIWTGTCAAIVSIATAGMLAQTTAQTPAPQTTPAGADKITVTGCLKAAPSMPGDTAAAANPNPTGTAGTTSPAPTGTSGAAESKFLLTGATASPVEAAGGAQTYRLIANRSASTSAKSWSSSARSTRRARRIRRILPPPRLRSAWSLERLWRLRALNRE